MGAEKPDFCPEFHRHKKSGSTSCCLIAQNQFSHAAGNDICLEVIGELMKLSSLQRDASSGARFLPGAEVGMKMIETGQYSIMICDDGFQYFHNNTLDFTA